MAYINRFLAIFLIVLSGSAESGIPRVSATEGSCVLSEHFPTIYLPNSPKDYPPTFWDITQQENSKIGVGLAIRDRITHDGASAEYRADQYLCPNGETATELIRKIEKEGSIHPDVRVNEPGLAIN